MNFSTTGWARSQTDPLYKPSLPNLVTTMDNDIRHNVAVAVVTTASAAYGSRCVIPRAGTLTDLAIYVGGQSGNVDVGVYDTNATTRNKLYSTGSIACPAANAWAVVGAMSLAVVAGQQLDLTFACDNITATFARLSVITASFQLPTNFIPASGGAKPAMWWVATASFPLPTTIAEASLAGTSFLPLIIARVV